MEMLNTTKIVMAWKLLEEGVPQIHIAKRLEVNKDTVRSWVKGLKESGLSVFLDQYQNAKKGPRVKRHLDPRIKIWGWKIRERVSYKSTPGVLSCFRKSE